VKDPAVSLTIGLFSIVTDVPNLMLSMKFELMTEGGSTVIDSSVITHVVSASDVKLTIYTKDNSKVGSNIYFVRATLNNVKLPYYNESNHFMIEVLHQCYRNVISSS
jgi:hypothetical protein